MLVHLSKHAQVSTEFAPQLCDVSITLILKLKKVTVIKNRVNLFYEIYKISSVPVKQCVSLTLFAVVMECVSVF